MTKINLFEHQRQALELTQNNNRCAYYLDMGLGKTFVGSEKLKRLKNPVNLLICQKSKIDDWLEHFKTYYSDDYNVCDLTRPTFWKNGGIETALKYIDVTWDSVIFVINYELAFRRPELKQLSGFTLMLDESSLIQNETAKRSKFILKLHFENLILLSGTPTGGKYERLWSQLTMLGYPLSKQAFYKMYVDYHYEDNEGFPLMVIDGYKNVERLKRKMRNYGCVFMKSDEVFNLPKQNFIDVKVNVTKDYRTFKQNSIVSVSGVELVGDTTLTKMLYERQLCGHFNPEKLEAFNDLAESTNDRLIVFYNFNAELDNLIAICNELERPYSVVNGDNKDLTAYEQQSNSITFIQYQAGAMGLNLQKANKIVYFTPPLSSEIYEQSKKRIHRIGQEQPCFYYKLVCKNSIENRIYSTLDVRRDYTDKLFEEQEAKDNEKNG